MKQLSSRIVQLGMGIVGGLVCAGTLSCSSNSPSNGSTPSGTGGASGAFVCASPNLPLLFAPMYSAYDGGTHTFQVPTIANIGVSGAAVTWSASDPSMVTFENDDATGGQIITTLKSGTVTIQAKAGDRCGTSLLTITAADPADWEIGDKRYNSGFPLPPLMMGAQMAPANGSNPLEVPGKPPACTNCHGETATSSVFKTVSHTPQQTGGFSDDELTAVFMDGVIPAGGYYDSSIVPQRIWSSFHKWTDITDAQKKGVLVYLRALTPKPQGGMIDFQKLRGSGGSNAGAGGGTAAGGASGTGAGGTSAAGGTTSAAGGTTSAAGGTASAAGGTASAAGGTASAGGSSAGGGGGAGGT